MARGVMRTVGAGAIGFAVALAIAEARAPGSAAPIVQSTVNGAVPVVQGVGMVAGETLGAAAPVVAGAQDAVGAINQQQPQQDQSPATLPVTPIAGG